MGGGKAADPLVQALLAGKVPRDVKERLMQDAIAQEADLEKNVQARMDEIQRSKKMSEAEKLKLLDKLEEFERKERKEQRKKQKMIAKVSEMQAKILQGKEHKREYLELQSQLQRQREEHQRIKEERLRLEEQKEEYILDKKHLEKKCGDQKEELREKRRLEAKLDARLEKARAQFEEVKEQFGQEMEALDEECQALRQQELFNEKVIQSYFDPETQRRVEEALVFNSASDSFRLAEICDVEVNELCQMYANIKQLQEKDLRAEVDPAEENILLFYSSHPFLDFRC